MTYRSSNLHLWATVAALIAGSLGWPASSARATTFNFELPTGSTPTTSFTGINTYQDWVGVNASALPNFVYQDQNGLGVVQNPIVPTNPGVNAGELLQLQFTSNVLLDGVTFTALGPSPDMVAVVMNSTILYWGAISGGGTGTYSLSLTGLALNQRIGSVVQFMVLDPFSQTPTDSFQLGSITVDQVPGAPLPTGFGIGLVMFTVLALVELVRRPARRTHDRE